MMQIVEDVQETQKRLESMNDEELIKLLRSIDRSIKNGESKFIYYQEWSVGSIILKKRNYDISVVRR